MLYELCCTEHQTVHVLTKGSFEKCELAFISIFSILKRNGVKISGIPPGNCFTEDYDLHIREYNYERSLEEELGFLRASSFALGFTSGITLNWGTWDYYMGRVHCKSSNMK